jgi:phage-related protein
MKKWTIEYYNHRVQDWVCALPIGLRADYARLTSLLMEFGVDLRLPHSRAMGDGLFELRIQSKEGIGRLFYCTLVGKRIVILHGFIKKTQKTPPKELDIAKRRMKEVKSDAQKY